MFQKTITIYSLQCYFLLVSFSTFSQTEIYKPDFQSEKLLGSLLLANNTQPHTPTLTQKQFLVLDNNKKITPLDLEKEQDTINKTLLKAKIDTERWRCTNPDPKKIEAAKSTREKFKNKK